MPAMLLPVARFIACRKLSQMFACRPIEAGPPFPGRDGLSCRNPLSEPATYVRPASNNEPTASLQPAYGAGTRAEGTYSTTWVATLGVKIAAPSALSSPRSMQSCRHAYKTA